MKIILKILIITIAILFLIQNNICVRATSSELIDSTMRVVSIESEIQEKAGIVGGCVLFIVIVLVVVIANAVKKKDDKKSNIDSSEVKKLKMEAKDYKIDSWGELFKIIIISAFGGVIGYFFGTLLEEPVSGIILGACFPWGYSVIGKIFDDWVELYAFLASGWLWFIVFVLKIFLSLVLGAIIMPIKLVISIIHIVQAHNLSNEVDSLTKKTVESENESIVEKEIQTSSVENNIVNQSDDEVVNKLRKLKQMKDEKIISEDEYENKKKELLTKI